MYFQILDFTENHLDKATIIEFEFQYDEKATPFHARKWFSCKENALQYLRDNQRAWVLRALEKYLLHKKDLLEDSNNGYYSTEAKKEALNMWFEALDKLIKEDSLAIICDQIIKGSPLLVALLDKEETSRKKLESLISFCKSVSKSAKAA